MRVFVSYARADNSIEDLRAFAVLVRHLGKPYVDDLEPTNGVARRVAVEKALRAASTFVAVSSPHYLGTPWTQWEFGQAHRRGIPILALLPNGSLVDSSSAEWPWPEWQELASGYDGRMPSYVPVPGGAQ